MFRDTFLQSRTSGFAIEPVDTPIGPTFVRTMTAGEKDEFDQIATKDGKFRSRLVMLCCCDADGRREFTARDLADLDAMPLTAIEPIVDAAMRLNKLGPKEQEELRKNSASPPEDGSSE
jgi:hypothetical protein